ncbi:MAG: hypothetical protein E7164_01010 [Firmicutes bacterium]|nr:hypothetical protein [Bacillota bacterium]
MNNIKLFFVILDEGYDKKMNALLNRLGVKVKLVLSASGTASPSILDYFGLVETKKSIYISIILDETQNKVIQKIKGAFNLEKEGTGIAFALPISSSNKFLSDTLKKNAEGKKEKMEKKNCAYHLLITMVLEGYLESVLTAVKRAGCLGGTVIKGRELASMIPKKILGISIEPEREIIFNIVHEKDRQKVMDEITKSVGIKTEAKGICLSLPVDDVVGLERYE